MVWRRRIRRGLLRAACAMLMVATAPTPAGPSNPCVQGDKLGCPAALRIITTTADLPGAEQGVYYEQAIEAQGGKPDYKFELNAGSKLPDGLKLMPSGRILGKPATAGDFTFTVRVSDASGAAKPVMQSFMLRVAAPPAPAPKAVEAPLRIVTDSVNLPAARQGVDYEHVVATRGGKGKPVFSYGEGEQPPGIKLSADGRLYGKPKVAGQFEFTVKASDDAAGDVTQQIFVLRVNGVAKLPEAPWTQPPEPVPWDIGTLVQTEMVSYMLTEVALAGIAELPPDTDPASVPTPAPAPAPRTAAADDAQAQEPPAEPEPMALRRGEMLKPLLNVDYPTRELFESALDAAQCAYAKLSVRRELKHLKDTRLLAVVDNVECAHKPAAPTKKRGLISPAQRARVITMADAETRVNEEAAQVFPTELRATLVDRARREHRFNAANTIRWDGGTCGCVLEDLSGEVVALYPFWQADRKTPSPLPGKDKPAEQPKPQAVNFSVMTRISYMGVSFNDDGNFAALRHWDVNAADFIREARQHRTKVDLVVHRNDWGRLMTLDDTQLSRTIGHAAHSAVELIDTPLTDIGSRMQRRLPGYNANPVMGDGITLYFTDFPNGTDDASAKFATFFSKFVKALATEMSLRQRPYGLNIVMSDQQIGRAPFDYPRLYDLILQTENPAQDHGRIRDEGGRYTSSTNVTLRFFVLLSEPTTDSKKELRLQIERDSTLFGNNRRVFLRKTVPVISYGGADPQQFSDDLAYFEDNFGGVGFWGLPSDDDKVGHAAMQQVRSVMRTDDAADDAHIAYLVCDYLWTLRALGEILIAGVAVALALYFTFCQVRRMGRPYLAVCVAAAVAWIVVMVSLALWDPQFSNVRRHQALFWSGFVAAICVMGAAWMYYAYRERSSGEPA